MSSTPDPTDTTLHAVKTKFVTEEFETEVPAGTVETLAEAIEDSVRNLRSRIVSDDRLEELLRSEPGREVLTSKDSRERSDPEPLTKQRIIEPLFAVLDYDALEPEAGDFADERGQQADYSVSLRDHDDIGSNRLLIEAEPLNKKLHQDKHGLGQVREWLPKDKFEADFGIATDGMRWVLIKRDRDTYSFDTIAEVSLQPVFVAAFENVTGPNDPVSEWVDSELTDLLEDFVHPFGFENFLSIAGNARQIIKETKEAITDEFYDDYVRLVFGVAEEGEKRVARSLIGEGVIASDAADGDDVRLFSVELMNRLIFIEFLEDKGLVNEGLLTELRDAHTRGVHPQSLYTTFIEPLFFGVLDERPGDRPPRIRQEELYSEVPYLNGGLFRPTTYETGGVSFEDTDFDVRDSVLVSIIDLLERYDFSADGGPTDLDPSVLGNVFEKTINYITGDQGDQKKELGAYYTPDEITRFCAEETVRPALLKRFGERLVAEWGWTEGMIDGYDDIHGLIEALPPNTDLVEDLLRIVDDFRALDPACGSGHFLTSVQGELVEIRRALYDLHDEDPQNWELHKRTVVQNVYGVDIVEPAVEIAKLRLWLSIIAEVDSGELEGYDEEDLALPNVVFNVRQGNSLIGFTELMETTGDGDQAQLDSWGADSVREKYNAIIEQIELHKQATDTDEAREYLNQANDLIAQYRGDLDRKLVSDFEAAGVDGISVGRVQEFEPFHWVLEFAPVYADGGFDAIVGNPPWDQLRATRDDYFPRFDEQFRGRLPSDKDQKQAELLEQEHIAQGWEEYKEGIEIQMRYFTDGSAYQLQKPTVAGRIDPNENNLAALFLERVFDLIREDGYVSQVIPGAIFNGSYSKDLRLKLLDEAQVSALAEFENHGIFDQLHAQYEFGVLVFRNGGTTDVLRGIFDQRDIDILRKFNEVAVEIPKRVLLEYSPEARTFPYISSKQEVDVLDSILNHPSLNDEITGKWKAVPHVEIHRTRDADRFVEDESEGDYPVYEGKNFYQFVHDNSIDPQVESPALWSVSEDTKPEKSAQYRARERQYNGGYLKNAIYEAFGGPETSQSKKGFVNDLLQDHREDPLSEWDIQPYFTEYRIGFRDITNSTNERTMIATVLPPNVVCVNTIRILRPFRINVEEDDLANENLHSAYERIFTDEELFVVLGLLNSIPFDFLMRTKVGTHIVQFKFTESQMPRLTAGDPWFEYISTRAARMNCYGEAFAEMRERLGGIDPATDPEERKRLQAEIDAAAFHAYGLDRDETAFVLEDFHRVRDPRLMTEEYFELILKKYDELADR